MNRLECICITGQMEEAEDEPISKHDAPLSLMSHTCRFDDWYATYLLHTHTHVCLCVMIIIKL